MTSKGSSRNVSGDEGRDAGNAVADWLAFSAPAIEPPAGLRERVLSAMPDGSVNARVPGAPGGGPRKAAAAHIETQHEGDWYSPVPGVQCKRLFADERRGYRSTLMRMQPGSTFPAHVHRGVEEACVLEGRCEFDGVALDAGDYFRAAAGTRHGTLNSPAGCLMIILEHARDGR